MLFLSCCCLQMNAQTTDTTEVGLVLSGGGALGLAHIGVLQYLEELGVGIDRIGGTSMGGIVGGLYAMGYTAEELKSMAGGQNWDYLLSNDLERRQAPLSLKDEPERYLLTLQREKEAQLQLSDALVNGINIYQFLQELCAPVRAVEDFEDLPLPFYCIAVDLNSGEPIVLDKGYMADVLLATMAIPGIFQPVMIDDYLLVDGGVLNNFPVKEMRDKGADLVVGVTFVNEQKKQSNSGFSSILTKTYDVVIQNARSVYEGECDICIEVDISGFSASDFVQVDSLIARGYAAAKAAREKLIPLQRQRAYSWLPKQPLMIPKLFNIEEFVIEGNKSFTKEIHLEDLGLDEFQYTLDDIQEAMERIQASGKVDRVYYELPDDEADKVLRIRVDERQDELLKIGLNYDSDFGAGILIHPHFQNVFGMGSLLEAELRLDRNPYLQINYQTNTLRKLTPEIELTLLSEEYYEHLNDEDFNSNRLIQLQSRLTLHYRLSTSVAARFGVEHQWYGISDNAQRDVLDGFGSSLWNYYVNLKADIMDNGLFPNRGFKTKLTAKAVSTNFLTYKNANLPLWVSAAHRHVFPIQQQTRLILNGHLGFGMEDDITPQYAFYQGGLMSHQRDNFIPQLGLSPMRYVGQHAAALEVAIRYDWLAKNHFYLKYNLSNLSDSFGNLWRSEWQSGVGVSYALNTTFAPIELQLSSLTSEFHLIFLLTAGFDF